MQRVAKTKKTELLFLALFLKLLKPGGRAAAIVPDGVLSGSTKAHNDLRKILVDEQAKKIRLTEKETNILKYLYRAGEKPVSREELLTEVWGYNAGVTTHTLETHVYRLRQKIEPDPGSAKILLTEAGGYRLSP